jgi:hypothetical protein
VVIISNQTIHVNAQTLLSPLKQLELGIKVQDIKCKEGWILIIKESNEHSACVKPTTITRLFGHGWITLEKFEAVHQIINQTRNVSIPKQTSISNVTINTTTPVNVTEAVTNLTSESNPPSFTYRSNETERIFLYHGIEEHVMVLTTMFEKALPTIQVTPTSLQESDLVKILSVGMSPNPLKVGDIPRFTLTYQNISGKPIFQSDGCNFSSLREDISPSDSVVDTISGKEHTCTGSVQYGYLYPRQIYTSKTLPVYQIIKSGTLGVTLNLYGAREFGGNWERIGQIQFNLNATQ